MRKKKATHTLGEVDRTEAPVAVYIFGPAFELPLQRLEYFHRHSRARKRTGSEDDRLFTRGNATVQQPAFLCCAEVAEEAFCPTVKYLASRATVFFASATAHLLSPFSPRHGKAPW
jgi:hypothetical protein